jgi:hypothetical protein
VRVGEVDAIGSSHFVLALVDSNGNAVGQNSFTMAKGTGFAYLTATSPATNVVSFEVEETSITNGSPLWVDNLSFDEGMVSAPDFSLEVDTTVIVTQGRSNYGNIKLRRFNLSSSALFTITASPLPAGVGFIPYIDVGSLLFKADQNAPPKITAVTITATTSSLPGVSKTATILLSVQSSVFLSGPAVLDVSSCRAIPGNNVEGVSNFDFLLVRAEDQPGPFTVETPANIGATIQPSQLLFPAGAIGEHFVLTLPSDREEASQGSRSVRLRIKGPDLLFREIDLPVVGYCPRNSKDFSITGLVS